MEISPWLAKLSNFSPSSQHAGTCDKFDLYSFHRQAINREDVCDIFNNNNNNNDEDDTWTQKLFTQLEAQYLIFVQELLLSIYGFVLPYCADCWHQIVSFLTYLTKVICENIDHHLQSNDISAFYNERALVFTLKFLLLLLFLFAVHWLKTYKNSVISTVDGDGDATNNLTLDDRNCITAIALDPTKITTEIVQDFNYKNAAELRKEVEKLNEALLEIEEKRRRKRFTKKRKCVSAGPILIALRRQKQKKCHIDYKPSELLVKPSDLPLNHIPIREKPLCLDEAVVIELTPDETEILAYMCVYKLIIIIIIESVN